MQIAIVAAHWGLSVDDVLGAALEAERLGFPSFYLGDHFFVGPQIDSWDPYLLFTLMARATTAIRFGPFVTPVGFRPPWELGRWAAQLDVLSGQRFVMGLGVGWGTDEHRAYGVPYGSLGERFDRLDEYIQVMKLMWSEGPATFTGRYYHLDGANSLPKPVAGRPPILIGGGGERRTLRLVAEYAGEWNAPSLTPESFRRKREVLDGHCQAVGRDPSTIRRSMLSLGPIGATQVEVDEATRATMVLFPAPAGTSLADYRQSLKSRGSIVGGADEILDSLGRLSEAGVDEIVLVYAPGVLDFLASEVLPKASAL